MTEGNGTQRILGEHTAAIDAIQEDVSEIKADVKALLARENKRDGAWKVITLLGTIGGGISGLVVSYLGLGK